MKILIRRALKRIICYGAMKNYSTPQRVSSMRHAIETAFNAEYKEHEEFFGYTILDSKEATT
jgi:predicted transcriptional regulator